MSFQVDEIDRALDVNLREAAKWAETHVATHPLAGRVTPAQVAAVVVRAITEDRREVDVAPLGARLAVASPRLIGPVARRLGATAIPPAPVERQRIKR